MDYDYLCKCNNCDAILIDRNPQVDAPKLPLQGNEEQMQWLEDKDGEFWGCPHCKTDGYLMDLPHNKIAQGLVFDAIPLRMRHPVTENLKEGAVVRPKLSVSPR